MMMQTSSVTRSR